MIEFNLAICDDEQEHGKRIYDFLNEFYAENAEYSEYIFNVEYMHNGNELVEYAKKTRLNAVFLDIAMPDMTGFAAAKELQRINENTLLIFVSSMENMVYDSYEYHPFWFIPKTQMNMLNNVVQKVTNKIIEQETEVKIIKLDMGNQSMVLNMSKVLYIYTGGHYVYISYADGTISGSYRGKLDDIQKNVSDRMFIRIHRRYMVNLRFVRAFSGNDIVLNTGEKLPVSRNNMENVKKRFYENKVI